MDVLERKVDSQDFLEAYNTVQSQLQEKRVDRKRTAAAEAITDPHAFAKRKISKNLKKRDAVKRKVRKRFVACRRCTSPVKMCGHRTKLASSHEERARSARSTVEAEGKARLHGCVTRAIFASWRAQLF